MLRPGEGVLVPEATQMLGGPRGINFLNRKAEAARMPVGHFQRGGVARKTRDTEDLSTIFPADTPLATGSEMERDFSPDEEIKYQFRDKLGNPVPVQHFQAGGVGGDGNFEPGDLPGTYGTLYPSGHRFSMSDMPGGFNGSYYPPDFQGPDSGPKPPYVGRSGGSGGIPEQSWMPDEYRNFFKHHGGDWEGGGDGSGIRSLDERKRILDGIANLHEGQSGRWDRFNGWEPGFGSGNPNYSNQGDSQRGVDPGRVLIGDETAGSGPEYGTNPGNLDQSGAYDPNYPYGSTGSGSGVPTQRAMGLLGNLIGGGVGSLIPGGSMLGSQLGGIGARMLTRMFQNNRANRPPAGYGDNQGDNQGGGYQDGERRNAMSGGAFGGLPEGFNESNRFGGGAPTFTGPGDFGPNFTGDSVFGGRTNLSMALPGSFAGLGEGSAGDIPFFSRMIIQQMRSGQPTMEGGDTMDALMKFGAAQGGGMGANNAGAVMLPQSQWSGGGGGSARFGPNGRQMNNQ